MECADIAKELYRHIGPPGYNKFIGWITTNYIRNCSITVDDTKRWLHIYGKDLIKLKATVIRKALRRLGAIAPVDMPPEIWEHHQKENVATDYLCVQGIPHFHLIEEVYKFRKIATLKGSKASKDTDVIKRTKQAINVYHTRKLTVDQLNTDNQFRCVDQEILPVSTNIVAAGEHVGLIKRSVRTVKKGTRYHVHRLPYLRHPIAMVNGCVVKTTKDLSNIPTENGVSRERSLATMIAGRPPPDFHEVMKLNFGDYVQAHTVSNKTDSNEPITVGSIALYPSENSGGSLYFMSLLTVRLVHRYQWDVLPLSENGLQRVQEIALVQGQRLVASIFRYQ